MQKARGPIAKKVTQSWNGMLSLDPITMENQLVIFEREIIKLGWAVQGKESCRVLWGMLTAKHRAILQHTNCFHSLRKEKFKDEHNMPSSSGFSSIVTALRTHFSGSDSAQPVGSYLACEYEQFTNETMHAFLELNKRNFAKDLNTEWDT